MKLETKRLILRRPRQSDWKDIVEACSDLDITKNLIVVPYPYRKRDALDWIKHSSKKKKDSYTFFIELKSEKKVIGATSLEIDDHNKIGKSGSWINKRYWKKGYITEAKIAVNNFAFNKLKLRKLESGAFVSNKASDIMQKKMGYKFEGTRRKHAISKATGKIHDENMYGLMKEEWNKVRPKLVKRLNKKLSKK